MGPLRMVFWGHYKNATDGTFCYINPNKWLTLLEFWIKKGKIHNLAIIQIADCHVALEKVTPTATEKQLDRGLSGMYTSINPNSNCNFSCYFLSFSTACNSIPYVISQLIICNIPFQAKQEPIQQWMAIQHPARDVRCWRGHQHHQLSRISQATVVQSKIQQVCFFLLITLRLVISMIMEMVIFSHNQVI